jgi:beta-glucanase (GH16 family)
MVLLLLTFKAKCDMKKMMGIVWFSAILLFACGNKEAVPTSVVPTNLLVNAVVSTDNSGNVSFTATASNASTYEYDYGNGTVQIIPSGAVTYKYPVSGTYTVNVIAKSSTGESISKSIQVTVTIILNLVFQDEFETPGAPDPLKWSFELGTGSNGWGNNELQYYTSRTENANISNGTLKITAIRESYSGSAFTSARLVSQNKYSFKYGRVEARAKLPTGVGTWPAIWMLGGNVNTISWPACGEIDIMEHVGAQQNKIFGTLHYPARYGANGDGGTTVIPDASTAFHIYSMEWNPLFIKIYVDGNLFHTVANSATLPFNQNFFFILNFAMGGNFGGPVEAAFTKASLEIDYIRVYQ